MLWQSGGVGGGYSFCKGGSWNRCIRGILKVVLGVVVFGGGVGVMMVGVVGMVVGVVVVVIVVVMA